jgi:hypothetical protein
MGVCVCVCVCLFASACLSVFLRVPVCMSVCVCLFASACLCVCFCASLCACYLSVCVCLHLRVSVCISVCVCLFAYAVICVRCCFHLTCPAVIPASVLVPWQMSVMKNVMELRELLPFFLEEGIFLGLCDTGTQMSHRTFNARSCMAPSLFQVYDAKTMSSTPVAEVRCQKENRKHYAGSKYHSPH